MSVEEFDNQFDVLYNNITSNQAPGLNTYEKSVFLTKAQDEILKNYFNPKGNKYQEGFDGNQKRQIDFSMITKVYQVSSSSQGTTASANFSDAVYDPRANSKSIVLPDRVMMIVNERISVTRNNTTVYLTVVPLNFEEYNRLMSKPYKRPLKYQAWRLINSGANDSTEKADLIVGPNDEISEYTMRYVKRPKPIILGSLDGLTIDGYQFSATQGSTAPVWADGCELDPILHEEILQRAVELAKVAWTATGQDNMQPVMQAGQRSE